MTPNPPPNQDIIYQLKQLNKSTYGIYDSVSKALDPFERAIKAFSKASEAQITGLTLGFKQTGFQEAFKRVTTSFEKYLPTLDTIEVAASLFESGIKNVNDVNSKTSKLQNQNLINLAARLKATGQNFKSVGDTLVPLSAELKLNNEGLNDLARGIEENVKATGMSAEALIRLSKTPGGETFGLFGLGKEFALATNRLKGMFSQLEPQLNQVFKTFFEDPLQGMQKALAIGVGDEFRAALSDPSFENIARFLKSASDASMRVVDGVDNILKPTVGAARLLGDRATFFSLAQLQGIDFFKQLPKELSDQMADIDTRAWQFSILNIIEKSFNPMTEVINNKLIPSIVDTSVKFEDFIMALGFAKTAAEQGMAAALLKQGKAAALAMAAVTGALGVGLFVYDKFFGDQTQPAITPPNPTPTPPVTPVKPNIPTSTTVDLTPGYSPSDESNKYLKEAIKMVEENKKKKEQAEELGRKMIELLQGIYLTNEKMASEPPPKPPQQPVKPRTAGGS